VVSNKLKKEKRKRTETINGKKTGNIDYRCEDGHFPVSASFMKISTPDSLPSSETGIIAGTIS
jgi:hypothetical protein